MLPPECAEEWKHAGSLPPARMKTDNFCGTFAGGCLKIKKRKSRNKKIKGDYKLLPCSARHPPDDKGCAVFDEAASHHAKSAPRNDGAETEHGASANTDDRMKKCRNGALCLRDAKSRNEKGKKLT